MWNNPLVDQIGLLGVVELDLIGLGLPVGREHHDSLGFDLLSDLLADRLQDGVDGVGLVVLDVRLGTVC
jgi:hypothetical protein